MPERLAERGYNRATLIARELVCRFDATTGAPDLRVDADVPWSASARPMCSAG